MALFAIACIVAYAAFVQWVWGWGPILRAWSNLGFWTTALALVLLVATYFIRTHRIQNYFLEETTGRFLWLFRVTQIHNLVNIMLPFRSGETSFPLLMRSEFGVPLARGTSALVVLRLLDLHALLAAAGVGMVAAAGFTPLAWLAWLVFLALPVVLFPFKKPVLAMVRRRLHGKWALIVEQVEGGLPADMAAFLRAWILTVFNWGIKVVVLAWVLRLMGIDPLAACVGGALGGELSSVLPVHAPGGVGTYPAGIAAGAAAFGAGKSAPGLSLLAEAGINLHLLITVSALAGTYLSLVLPAMAGLRTPKPST